ncbi:homeobox-domain-containing protein [Panus rudis PR-1116 ss-1]|nr:homeobox-domain-containing protein [Panus rudis PR-1116 ss-1]
MKEQDDKGKGKGKGKAARRSSPSASSSQGDMADTEMEAGSSQPAEEEQEKPAPPPKKKRTRTLTTPHQAAVLHALLAQSRFPTTQMREEVGRSIGLSARKVQIWFQNQRQKARRPRGQNAPPLSRPPQYGPYTNVPLGDLSSRAGPSGQHRMSGEERPTGLTGPEPTPYSSHSQGSSSAVAELYARDPYSSEGYRRSSGSLPQLSGPGVPGSIAPSTYPTHSEQYGVSHPTSDRALYGTSYGQRLSPPRASPETLSRLSSAPSHPSRLAAETEGPRIVLPPLRIGSPSPPQSAPTSAVEHTQFGALASAPPHYASGGRHLSATTPTAESPFAHSAPPYIPPPFTLEPQPIWDDPSFSPFSRPSTSHASPTSPTYYAPEHTYPPHTPTHVYTPQTQLPSLTNILHESDANPQAHVMLPPIRSQPESLRPTAPSSYNQGDLPGPSAPGSSSRPPIQDTFRQHDADR